MPVTERGGKSRTRLFDVRFPFHVVAELLVLFVLASSGNALRAQTIAIKLVNGRSGRPMAGACIQVWVGDGSKPASGPLLQTQTDKDGVSTIRLTDEDTKISTRNQRLTCGLLGTINPVVKYGNTIGLRAGYVLCQTRTSAYSWLAMTGFPTTELLQDGIVTGNACGKATASPKPGEVVLFVRPLTWWEKLKQ